MELSIAQTELELINKSTGYFGIDFVQLTIGLWTVHLSPFQTDWSLKLTHFTEISNPEQCIFHHWNHTFPFLHAWLSGKNSHPLNPPQNDRATGAQNIGIMFSCLEPCFIVPVYDQTSNESHSLADMLHIWKKFVYQFDSAAVLTIIHVQLNLTISLLTRWHFMRIKNQK